MSERTCYSLTVLELEAPPAFLPCALSSAPGWVELSPHLLIPRMSHLQQQILLGPWRGHGDSGLSAQPSELFRDGPRWGASIDILGLKIAPFPTLSLKGSSVFLNSLSGEIASLQQSLKEALICRAQPLKQFTA